MSRRLASGHVLLAVVILAIVWMPSLQGQQPQRFGGAYADLDRRRQQLVDHWIARFIQTTGQSVEPPAFYDDIVTLSAKTTFDAVTHAVMTTRLSDRSGASLGDALGLVERIEAVRGAVVGARGDGQFRMYVRLTAGALEGLSRSREFKRGADNSVYHKGYPINYREQGGSSPGRPEWSREQRRCRRSPSLRRRSSGSARIRPWQIRSARSWRLG